LEIIMPRLTLGNILAVCAGVLAAVGTMLLSYYKLKVPQISLDWLALIFSGLTAGLIAFFIVWGHFQKEPGAEQNPPGFPVKSDE
jgi:drug/metabolite transporter (DMT)-like permease